MQISFNGIKNLYIRKKEYDKYGSYVTPNGTINQGDKHYTEVKISCNLTDDENGNDLTEFQQAISKCGSSMKYLNNSDNRITLHMIRQDVNDTNISMSDFKINNRDILLNDNSNLPMYSYMAHLTRKIEKLPTTYDVQKYYANYVNKSVDQEARKYLNL